MLVQRHARIREEEREAGPVLQQMLDRFAEAAASQAALGEGPCADLGDHLSGLFLPQLGSTCLGLDVSGKRTLDLPLDLVELEVATYVRSETQSWFGRVAVNRRWTRSAGRALSSPGVVVTLYRRPRTTPRSSMLRIRRSTVQRAT